MGADLPSLTPVPLSWWILESAAVWARGPFTSQLNGPSEAKENHDSVQLKRPKTLFSF